MHGTPSHSVPCSSSPAAASVRRWPSGRAMKLCRRRALCRWWWFRSGEGCGGEAASGGSGSRPGLHRRRGVHGRGRRRPVTARLPGRRRAPQGSPGHRGRRLGASAPAPCPQHRTTAHRRFLTVRLTHCMRSTRLGEHCQSRTMTISYSKQVKVAHTRLPSVGFPS